MWEAAALTCSRSRDVACTELWGIHSQVFTSARPQANDASRVPVVKHCTAGRHVPGEVSRPGVRCARQGSAYHTPSSSRPGTSGSSMPDAQASATVPPTAPARSAPAAAPPQSVTASVISFEAALGEGPLPGASTPSAANSLRASMQQPQPMLDGQGGPQPGVGAQEQGPAGGVLAAAAHHVLSHGGAPLQVADRWAPSTSVSASVRSSLVAAGAGTQRMGAGAGGGASASGGRRHSARTRDPAAMGASLDLSASQVGCGGTGGPDDGEDFEDACSQPPGTPGSVAGSVASGRIAVRGGGGEGGGTFFTALRRSFGAVVPGEEGDGEDEGDDAFHDASGRPFDAVSMTSRQNPMQSPSAMSLAGDDEQVRGHSAELGR